MFETDDVSPDRGRTGTAIESRRKLILEQIVRAGTAQVDELANRLGVSRMTIHRDLDVLAERGMVRKQHGGATIHESNSIESSFSYRAQLAEPQKQAIARTAVEMIRPGQSVILDESTTTLFMAQHLAGRTPLTVITNGIAMIERLKDQNGIQLIALGGTHNPSLNAFFGLLCENAIASLRANIVFMSTSAIFEGVVYHQDAEVLKIKRALLAIAETKVMIADSSKFGVTALNRVGQLDQFDHVITDRGLAEADRAQLADRNVALTIVDA